jgi:hypothetical protein
MNKLVLIMFMFSQICWAECDLAKDINKNADGSYTYSKECHLLMGQWKKDLEARAQQADELKKSIELKDLALTHTEQRVNLWRDTSFSLEDRLNKAEKMTQFDRWFHFGLGIVVTGAAVWGASKLK